MLHSSVAMKIVATTTGHEPEEQDVTGGLREVLGRADAVEVLQDAEGEESRTDRHPHQHHAVAHEQRVDHVLRREESAPELANDDWYGCEGRPVHSRPHGVATHDGPRPCSSTSLTPASSAFTR